MGGTDCACRACQRQGPEFKQRIGASWRTSAVLRKAFAQIRRAPFFLFVCQFVCCTPPGPLVKGFLFGSSLVFFGRCCLRLTGTQCLRMAAARSRLYLPSKLACRSSFSF